MERMIRATSPENEKDKNMAYKITSTLIDDIDGGLADETVRFALDGKDYEIDLTEDNATALRTAFRGYIESARRASKNGNRRRSTTTSRYADPEAAKMRKWAQDNGLEVSDRGRISQEIRQAYRESH